jgi:hypothetical protein
MIKKGLQAVVWAVQILAERTVMTTTTTQPGAWIRIIAVCREHCW